MPLASVLWMNYCQRSACLNIFLKTSCWDDRLRVPDRSLWTQGRVCAGLWEGTNMQVAEYACLEVTSGLSSVHGALHWILRWLWIFGFEHTWLWLRVWYLVGKCPWTSHMVSLSSVSLRSKVCVGGWFWLFLQDQITSDSIDKLLGIMSHSRGKLQMLPFLYFWWYWLHG